MTELGAINTFTVCPAAARQRGSEIGAAVAASVTLGVGQFCTKPGVAFVPAGPAGDAVVDALVADANATAPGVMLSERTAVGYRERVALLEQMPGVKPLARAAQHDGAGWWGSATVLLAAPDALGGPVLEECFGPAIVLVRYDSTSHLMDLLQRCGPALTATIHAEDDDADSAAAVLAVVQQRVGRVVWNSVPTGVAVSWAMHHGGPYPATTDVLHTSGGAASIRRWLRPICLQDVPGHLLPDELRDEPTGAPVSARRIDVTLMSIGQR